MGVVALVGLLVGLVLGPASCSDDTADTPPTTTPPPEAEVEDAYLAFWDMATRLSQAPDPDDPDLERFASGQALADLVAGLEALESQQRHSELGPGYRHEVLNVEVTDGDTAVVEDCAIDDSRIVDDETGEVLVEGVGTQLLSVDMVRREAQWIVDSIDELQVWEGAVPCV